MSQANLSLVTFAIPSYNTPKILETCLKALAFHHKHHPIKLIISENSTNDLTCDFLNLKNIPFLRFPGSRHSPSVQLMMDACQTRYLVHLDSDAILTCDISKILDYFINMEFALGGEMQGSRGGYDLFPRIAPYFCFMDLRQIKEKGCLFHDEDRIIESGSQGFFKNVPIQRNKGAKYYDCGSILFQDCVRNNLKIGAIGPEVLSNYITHYEGCSWRTASGIPNYVEWGNEINRRFFEETRYLESVEIAGKFIKGF